MQVLRSLDGIRDPRPAWRSGGTASEVELGAAKQRALLAVLLLHAGETMSTERLVDALWGEKPPATAVKALQVYVSQLRKALGDGVVETRPLGYVVRVEDGALDLQRFERLLDEGRRLLDAGAPLEAGEVLRRRSRYGAASRWRTSATRRSRHNEIGRLEELRLIALEQRLEADLAVGRNAECGARAGGARAGLPAAREAARAVDARAVPRPAARRTRSR